MAVYSDPTIVSVDSKGRLTLASYIILVAGIIAVLMAALFGYRIITINQANQKAQKDLTTRQADIKKLDSVASDLSFYSDASKSLESIFKNQIDWPAALLAMEGRLYKKMAVTSIQATDAGLVTFSGTLASYNEYANMYDSMSSSYNADYFSKIKVVSVNQDSKTGLVSFVYHFKVGDVILKAVDYQSRLAVLDGLIAQNNNNLLTPGSSYDALMLKKAGLDNARQAIQNQIYKQQIDKIDADIAAYSKEADSLTGRQDEASTSRLTEINNSIIPQLRGSRQATSDKMTSESKSN